MQEFTHSHTENGPGHLESLSPEDLLAWLNRALRRLEPLPVIVPDEPPEGPILRQEQELEPMTRKDLRTACLTLLRQFVRNPEGEEDDFTNSLIRLTKGLEIQELASDLSNLASQKELLHALPLPQQKIILGTLIDLRAALPVKFWQGMEDTLPAPLKPMAVTGLLVQDLAAAFEALKELPNDEGVADSIYVILDQHGRILMPEELRRMKELAAQITSGCKPLIADAVHEWMHQIPDVAPVEPGMPSSKSEKLNRALTQFHLKNMLDPYEPRQIPARLCGLAA